MSSPTLPTSLTSLTSRMSRRKSKNEDRNRDRNRDRNTGKSRNYFPIIAGYLATLGVLGGIVACRRSSQISNLKIKEHKEYETYMEHKIKERAVVKYQKLLPLTPSPEKPYVSKQIPQRPKVPFHYEKKPVEIYVPSSTKLNTIREREKLLKIEPYDNYNCIDCVLQMISHENTMISQLIDFIKPTEPVNLVKKYESLFMILNGFEDTNKINRRQLFDIVVDNPYDINDDHVNIPDDIVKIFNELLTTFGLDGLFKFKDDTNFVEYLNDRHNGVCYDETNLFILLNGRLKNPYNDDDEIYFRATGKLGKKPADDMNDYSDETKYPIKLNDVQSLISSMKPSIDNLPTLLFVSNSNFKLQEHIQMDDNITTVYNKKVIIYELKLYIMRLQYKLENKEKWVLCYNNNGDVVMILDRKIFNLPTVKSEIYNLSISYPFGLYKRKGR